MLTSDIINHSRTGRQSSKHLITPMNEGWVAGRFLDPVITKTVFPYQSMIAFVSIRKSGSEYSTFG
jgi:hypothetical protein